jgi:hypothetical protein
MKKNALSLAAMMLVCTSALAQSAQPAGAGTPNGQQANQAAPLSRDQVYHELVASRNDGSLVRVNKLYAHH